MSSILWKSFLPCFSNFKCTTLPPPTSTSKRDASSPSSTTSTLIKTFNSLYDGSTDSTFHDSSSAENFFSSNSDDDSSPGNSPPDFATVFASQRFFFASPGHSNSILHSPESTTPMMGGGIPIQTYSPDPYLDFRRSMQEMVEARELTNLADDWDFLHELLLCYLNLNPKHTHNFILSAFSDLLISLLSSKSHRKIDHRLLHGTG